MTVQNMLNVKMVMLLMSSLGTGELRKMRSISLNALMKNFVKEGLYLMTNANLDIKAIFVTTVRVLILKYLSNSKMMNALNVERITLSSLRLLGLLSLHLPISMSF